MYRPHEDDYSTFESLLHAKRVSHFLAVENIVKYTHFFAMNEPTKGMVDGNPFLQILNRSSERYPVWYLSSDTNRSPELLVGSG